MNDPGIIMVLVIATFAIVIVYAFYQLYRVKKAKREHHHSARTPAEVSRNEQR
jgi:cytochrome oxidase assembly protein ShyY1